MSDARKVRCPECGEIAGEVSRREFMRGVGTAAVAATAGTVAPLFATPRGAAATIVKDPPAAPETAVRRLYEGLSDKQKAVICMPWDHAKRTRISANWAITDPKIGEFFTKEQQATIREIFRGVTSGEGHDRFIKQMADDQGGFDTYHIAIFGEPGSDRFEWVLTGRHMTIRCNGNTKDGTAFGGPIIYGHGEGDGQGGLPGNVFYYQTVRANEVFKALDGKQRQNALIEKAPPESAVQFRKPGSTIPGIVCSELSKDQKELVERVMKDLLAPYRESDVKEALECLSAGGGLDRVHLSFYKQHDLGTDGVWDIWRLESPTFVWHFRGAPHVHAYINIASKPA